MVRTSKLTLDADGKPVETDIREIFPHRCPHYILVAEHYREDGICKCADPGALEMRAWGYKWSRKKGLWV